MSSLESLLERLSRFRDARGWRELHTPPFIAQAIAVEAAELQELYLWGAQPCESRELDELADVLIFCFNFALAKGLDARRLIDVVSTKIERNEERFPVS